MLAKRLLGLGAAGFAAVAFAASPAWAYLNATSSTVSPSATASTMTAPTSVTVTSIGGTATLSWTPPTTPSGATFNYTVARSGGSGAIAGSCATGVSTTTCQDTAATAGQTYTWTVTAHLGNWSSPTGSVAATAAGSLNKFVVSNPGNQTAGTGFSAMVTAEDSLGDTVTGYSGPQSVVWSGPSKSPAPSNTAPTYPSSVTIANGLGTANITLYDATTGVSLTATQGATTGTSGTFNVGVGPLNAFTLSNPGPVTAGVGFTETVTAVDAWDNTVASYSGAKTLSWSGPTNSPNGTSPTYPATATSVTFTNGQGSASGVKLFDAISSVTLTANASSPPLTGAASFAVNSAGVTLAFSPSGNVAMTKNATKTFTITVPTDLYGNTFTRSTGLIVNLTLSSTTHMMFASPLSGLAASITITSGPAGNTFGVAESGNNGGSAVTLSGAVASPFVSPASDTLNENG